MIEVQDFRDAMSLLTSAVSVVTTAGASGRYGFTASAICSVTDSPPTLLVCMNKSSYLYSHFIENKTLAVNVLGAHQQCLSQVFASKMLSEERFAQALWSEMKTGAPILQDALVSFDCELVQANEVGTHDVFICRIVGIRNTEQDQGLIYFNRKYHQIGQVLTS